MNNIKKILYGYFGFKNAGDEVILEIAKRHFPDSRVLSSKHRRESFLVSKSTVIFPGGSLLQDRTSLKSLFFYLSVISFFKKRGCKVYMLNQGIGPIKSELGKRLMYRILRSVDRLTVRTKGDYIFLSKKLQNVELGADTAFLLEPGEPMENSERNAVVFKTVYREKYPKIPMEWDILAFSKRDMANLLNIYEKKRIIPVYMMKANEMIDMLSKYERVYAEPLHAIILSYLAGVKEIFTMPYDIKVEYFTKEIKSDINLIDDFKKIFDPMFNPLKNNRKHLSKLKQRAAFGLEIDDV